MAINPGDFVTVNGHATFDLRPVSYPARLSAVLASGEALVYPVRRDAWQRCYYGNVRRVSMAQVEAIR